MQIATCSAVQRAIAEMESEDSFDKKRDLSSFKLCPLSKRFSAAQKACLTAHHSNGMTGTSKQFFHMIEKAADDTGLSVKQVKV